MAESIGLIDTGVQKLGAPFDSFMLDPVSVAGQAGDSSDPTHGTAMARTLLQGANAVNTPGSGSTFTVRLPLLYVDAPAEPQVAPVGRAKGPSVLAVEDNPVGLKVLRHALGRYPLDADFAADGRDALESARKKQYDIVLMDLQMPEMDGFTAAVEMRKIPGYERTPILALSANASDEVREQCRAHGMQAYLSKPVETQSLYKMLSTWIKPVLDRDAIRQVLAVLGDQEQVFGELVDSVPIFGSQRRIYVYIGGALVAAGLLMLAAAAGGAMPAWRPETSYRLASLAADQASKNWLLYGLDFKQLGPAAKIDVAPFFDLVMVWNRGVSYGMFQAGSMTGIVVLTVFSLVAVAALSWWLRTADRRLLAIGLGLVIGVDTGLLHLAAAYRVPLVGIYVSTDPGLTGPAGSGAMAVLGGKAGGPSARQAIEAAERLIS